MTHWHDAGFGTDPEGDARRRAELEAARVNPARLPARALDSPTVDALRVLDALRAPASEVVEPEVSDPHAITETRHGSSVAIVCACGRWECIVTGPSSAAWAGRDYRRHVADETAAAPDA